MPSSKRREIIGKKRRKTKSIHAEKKTVLNLNVQPRSSGQMIFSVSLLRERERDIGKNSLLDEFKYTTMYGTWTLAAQHQQ